MKRIALAALCLVLAGPALAQTAPPVPAPVTPNDYSLDASWLCKPGRKDACTVDLATTIVKADGSFTREDWKADPNAPIDFTSIRPSRPIRRRSAI
jgi:hypothetical protein